MVTSFGSVGVGAELSRIVVGKVCRVVVPNSGDVVGSGLAAGLAGDDAGVRGAGGPIVVNRPVVVVVVVG